VFHQLQTDSEVRRVIKINWPEARAGSLGWTFGNKTLVDELSGHECHGGATKSCCPDQLASACLAEAA